jgi:hypothetical protein
MGWFGGKRILVTGGTGCIGSRLIAELSKHHPAQLVSISLGLGKPPWPHVEGAEYRQADIRIRPQLLRAFAGGPWDVVFHTAAQRDPGLAEQQVHRTVSTNVFGTVEVLHAAEVCGVQRFVSASTGKALRPFSPDTYTASKRAAEWLLASSAIPFRGCSRFTHVIDNSIFYYDRLLPALRYGKPAGLHSASINFYIQSAVEAAETLMGIAVTCADGIPVAPCGKQGIPVGHAITDLGWPVNLYDFAVACRDDMGSDSEIQITGYDPGYEAKPFPGLYDPNTAGDVSPLINAFEAAESFHPYPGVDAFPLAFAGPQPDLSRLRAACDPRQHRGNLSPDRIRQELAAVSWDVMRCAVAAVQPAALQRVAGLCKQFEPLSWPHDTMLAVISEAAGMSVSAS